MPLQREEERKEEKEEVRKRWIEGKEEIKGGRKGGWTPRRKPEKEVGIEEQRVGVG